jgi:hypothetical protein
MIPGASGLESGTSVRAAISGMRFYFHPLRFEFIARETLYFPPGLAANILRGALGMVSRKIAPIPEFYARVFAPATHGAGPSGLADWPRPFVFRARCLDGRTIQPGESFHFDLHVFSLDTAVIRHFVLTFAELAREGLGPRRAKIQLQCVRRFAFRELSEQVIFDIATQSITTSLEPAALDLDPAPPAPTRICVEFLSPTELKHEHTIVCRPEFPILFGRIRDRISTLRSLYGAGPLDIDFRGIGDRAAAVRMTRCEVRRQEADRRSTRTGQRHSIGGFVGIAEYEGELAEFLPYLEAGGWVGVGRQAVWGKGEIAVRGKVAPSRAA